ncbi:MAG: ATP-binding protein [Desulfobacteraceae bacterium]|jgi:PAS domain S-box-containing protein
MRIGFRTKFYIGLFSMLLLLGVITCIVVTRVMQTALLEENRKLGLAIGTSLAAQAVEPTLAMDFLLLRSLMIDTLRLEKEIRYAFIQDAGGAPLAHSFEGGFPSALKTANAVAADQPFQIRFLNTGAELVYDFAIPILAGEERLGTLRLGLTHNRVRQAVGHLVWVLVMSTGFVLLVAGFVGAGLLRHVTWRIERLHRSTEEALRGNLEVHAAPPLKKNCWEIMACANQDCPAYQDVYHRCWYLAGTLCPYCAAGDYAQKIGDCAQCPVYRRCAGDEIQTLAESFDSMVLSLRTHLSDLRDAEKTLKDQRQLLRTVLDGIPDFITLQDRHASYRAVNKAFGRILGRNVAEIVGKTNFDLLPRRMAEKFQAEDQAIYATGKSLVKETRTRTPSGERWFHVVKLPIYDADGHHAGFLCTGHDITDLKRIQEQLYQAQKMEAIGRLVAGIAHEINTPLGIALGFVQVLREEEAADSQIGRDLETVEKQIQVCKKIVADLLKFSRQSDTRHLPLDINETIEEVLAVVAHTLEINRVKLKRRLAENLPIVIGDREKLKQAFINLINNAFDAIGSDGTITIASRLDPVSREVIVTVTDTGPGIPPEKRDRIFEPFFTTKPVGKGTGLGLSLSFSIVEEHGGRLSLESPGGEPAAGGGATFAIRLPAAPGEPAVPEPGGRGNQPAGRALQPG